MEARTTIQAALASVRERIAGAAHRSGRLPEDITVVAVTKTHPEAVVRDAFAAGLRHFGENRVQEAAPKIATLADLRPRGAAFHLVGHLQSNKAGKAVEVFDTVQSVDSVELAYRLARLAESAGRVLPIMVEVDLAGEATKSGLPPADLFVALDAIRGLGSLRVEGLMVLPPYFEDADAARPFFVRLRELGDGALARGLLQGSALSMGMSHDFEVAIEEGATHVRIGTALFGARR